MEERHELVRTEDAIWGWPEGLTLEEWREVTGDKDVRPMIRPPAWIEDDGAR